MKLIIVAVALLVFSQSAVAQVTTAQIREQIANGECETAQSLYNVYKAMNGTDETIERLIEECQRGDSNSANGHDYVDLGLPSGTLWATCNLGANLPEEHGDYYAWGDTMMKATTWDAYKYANGGRNKLTKYCDNSEFGYNGFTDNLITLQGSDDPAAILWGGSWRTPTKTQWEELLQNTTSKWMMQNGLFGMLFIAKNGHAIFLPATSEVNFEYFYWSSSLVVDNPCCAWLLIFGDYDEERDLDYDYRICKCPVRPVLKR